MQTGSVRTPAGAMVDGRVEDPTAVGLALKQLVARSEIAGTTSFVAVSDALANFRVLKVAPTSTDSEIDSVVAQALSLDPNRMATQWTEIRRTPEVLEVYAVAWDRALVKKSAEAVRLAGLDPVVVELKSACVARVAPEPSCIVLETSTDPMEIFLIAGGVPQVWYGFHAKTNGAVAEDLARTLAGPLSSVLKFYRRRRDNEFTSASPILIAGEQMLPAQVVARLSEAIEQPVLELPAPPRVPPGLRYTAYMTCLGLIMRRRR